MKRWQKVLVAFTCSTSVVFGATTVSISGDMCFAVSILLALSYLCYDKSNIFFLFASILLATFPLTMLSNPPSLLFYYYWVYLVFVGFIFMYKQWKGVVESTQDVIKRLEKWFK